VSDDEKNDIPFEDSPPRPAGAEQDGAGAGAETFADKASGTGSSARAEPQDKTPKTENAGQGASEERTVPGPGSTGPSGVREDLGTLAEEARKLWSALEARVVAPAVQSYPEVARHLGAAGREVAAAFRSAVRGSEQSWRDGPGGDTARQQEKITVERVDRIDPSEKKNRD
jgi:hypothetical protein